MIIAVILSTVTLILFTWLSYEVVIMMRFISKGSTVTATVTDAQQYSSGDRMLEIELNDSGISKKFRMGYMSGGFLKLKCGDTMKVVYHPNINFVIPANLGGAISRPFIAAALFAGSLIVTISFLIPILSR